MFSGICIECEIYIFLIEIVTIMKYSAQLNRNKRYIAVVIHFKLN